MATTPAPPPLEEDDEQIAPAVIVVTATPALATVQELEDVRVVYLLRRVAWSVAVVVENVS